MAISRFIGRINEKLMRKFTRLCVKTTRLFHTTKQAPIPFSQQSRLPRTPDLCTRRIGFSWPCDLHAGTTVEGQGITKAIRFQPEGRLQTRPTKTTTRDSVESIRKRGVRSFFAYSSGLGGGLLGSGSGSGMSVLGTISSGETAGAESSLQPITMMVQPEIRMAPRAVLKIEIDFILEWVIS